MFLSILEASGSFLAILGAILAINKVNLIYPWICWLLGSVLFVILFTLTSQHGLLTLHIIGVLINSFGLYQWFHKDVIPSERLMHILFNTSIICASLGFISIFSFIFGQEVKSLEWAGSFFGIAGSLSLASRHKFAQSCWIFWTLGNLFVLVLTYVYTNQPIIAIQQFMFSVLNLIGLYKNYPQLITHHRISYLKVRNN